MSNTTVDITAYVLSRCDRCEAAGFLVHIASSQGLLPGSPRHSSVPHAGRARESHAAPAFSLTSCVTVGKSLHLSEPLLTHLEKAEVSRTYLIYGCGRTESTQSLAQHWLVVAVITIIISSF